MGKRECLEGAQTPTETSLRKQAQCGEKKGTQLPQLHKQHLICLQSLSKALPGFPSEKQVV